MNKDKQKALELLKQKINGEKIISYQEIANETSYSKMQIIRLSKEIEKKDIEDLLVHGLTGKNSNNSAPNQEIEYIKEFKAAQPSAEIILLVGAFDRFNESDLEKTGADDYLVKPFDSQSLNEKLSSDADSVKH